MSNDNVPALSSRAEKVQTFLRRPLAGIGIAVTGMVGALVTIPATEYFTKTLAADGDPDVALKAGLAGGIGVAFSLATCFFGLSLKDMLSEGEFKSSTSKRFFISFGFPMAFLAGMGAGALFNDSARSTHRIAQIKADIAALPEISGSTIMRPEQVVKQPAVNAFTAAQCGLPGALDFMPVKGADGVKYRVDCRNAAVSAPAPTPVG